MSVFLCLIGAHFSMNNKFVIFIGLALALGSAVSQAQYVIEDGGVGLTREELAYIVSKWPPQMQQSAAEDVGDRVELVSKALATSKLGSEFDKMSYEKDGDVYLESILILRDSKRRFMIDQFLTNLEVPDMSALAKERYDTDRDTYALVPEQKISSHILFVCRSAGCDPEERKSTADAVLAELRAGANFEEMVQIHSGDEGTKVKNGRFERWIARDETGVAKSYVIALHTIDEVGGYSDVIASEFGHHIIRLDEIKAEHYRPFEEVEQEIVNALDKEFRKRSLIAYVNSFGITDRVKIDGAAMEEIFSQYKGQNNSGSR